MVSLYFQASQGRTDRPSRRHRWTITMASIVGLSCLLSVGCLGLASNLMHAAGLDMIPAEYEGLDEQTVAVVVEVAGGSLARDPNAIQMTQALRRELLANVTEIQIVRDDKIAQWRDTHDPGDRDYTQMARDLDASRVLLVRLDNLKLRDGATLYRGTCDAAVEVIELPEGTSGYVRQLDEYAYPQLAGQPISETSLSKFTKVYMTTMAEEIVRSFRKYDPGERFALDGRIARSQ